MMLANVVAAPSRRLVHLMLDLVLLLDVIAADVAVKLLLLLVVKRLLLLAGWAVMVINRKSLMLPKIVTTRHVR